MNAKKDFGKVLLFLLKVFYTLAVLVALSNTWKV